MAEEDESALLDDIMSDKEPEPSKEPEPEAEEPAKGPERDPETGKFKSREAEPEPEVAPEAEPPVEAQPETDKRFQVPLAELLNTRERAQNAERERDDLKRETGSLRQRMQALEQQLQQFSQKKPDPIDFDADPEGWRKQQEDSFQQLITNERLNMSESMARLHFGDNEVDAALEWARTRPPHEVQAILSSRNPYADLVSRKKQADALAEIGTDPKAYREKVLSEAMKDPEFVKAVLSQAKTEAAGRPEQHVTKLPPSLNRQQSAANAKSDAGDPNGVPMSDAELLEDALRR